MKIENLKLGDIIVYELDEFIGNDNKRVTVVGSNPIIRDGVISFHPILKKNKKEEYFQSENVVQIDMENNIVMEVRNINHLVANDELKDQIVVANKKARWALDNIVVIEEDAAGEEVFEADAEVEHADAPFNPEVFIPKKKVYRFYVEVVANDDADPWVAVDLHEAIGDYADPDDPVETKVIELND